MEKLCRKTVMAYIEVLLQIFLKETHDTTRLKNVTLYPSQYSNLVPFQ